MTKVRVPVHRTSPTQSVLIDPAATVGAQIGTNLLMPDGTLATTAKLQALFGSTPGSSSSLDTTDDLEEGQWNLWFTDRRAQDAVGAILADTDTIDLAYGPGTSITATLRDLADSATGTLQAVTIDAKGRVSGYRDATITGMDGRVTVAHGDASDGVPTVDLDEVPDAGGGSLQKTAFDAWGRKTGTSAATTTDLSEGTNLYFTAARADARITLQKGQPNGLATLDAGGKLDTGQLPALAITETFVVDDEASMLALTAEQGDVAVRTDLSKSFILTTDDPTVLADWQDLLTPTSPVTSVFGRVGSVTAASGDYTFAQIADTPTTLAGYGITDAATAAQGATADTALQPGDSIGLSDTGTVRSATSTGSPNTLARQVSHLASFCCPAPTTGAVVFVSPVAATDSAHAMIMQVEMQGWYGANAGVWHDIIRGTKVGSTSSDWLNVSLTKMGSTSLPLNALRLGMTPDNHPCIIIGDVDATTATGDYYAIRYAMFRGINADALDEFCQPWSVQVETDLSDYTHLTTVNTGIGDVLKLDVAVTSANTAVAAAELLTPRNIAGVPFDGSADIDIPFANLSDIPAALGTFGTTSEERLLLIGDGSTDTAQLKANGVDITSGFGAPSIWRTDWQGRQLLYATARTNLATQSQDLSNELWTKSAGGTGSAPVVTANYATAPDGTATADRVQFSIAAGTTSADISQLAHAPLMTVVGNPYVAFICARTNDESTVAVTIVDANGVTSLINVTPVWQKFAVTTAAAIATSSIPIRIRLKGNEATAKTADLLVWGLQFTPGLDVTSYIPTTTATVTVTDYAVDSTGLVSFGETPVTGAVCAWAGWALP